jgi:hypothetical protein
MPRSWLGHTGRFDARFREHLVDRWNDPGRGSWNCRKSRDREARRRDGAAYVGVKDIDAAADRIRSLGGAVYVPPTDSNIGRVAIVADPQTANFALVKGLKSGQMKRAEPGKAGHVGWHELFATLLGEGAGFLRRVFLAGRKRTWKSMRRNPIGGLPSTGRRSAA